MPIPLTVVIPTLNEAEGIAEAVGRLAWADEVIVADGGSTDDTVERARGAGARVLERTGPTIAAQRNAAIAAARNRWILALDADERVPRALQAEIAAGLAAPAAGAYRMRLRTFYLGREFKRAHGGQEWKTRLFTSDRRYVERRVHESLEPGPEPASLRECLLHYPYRDISHHHQKLDRYARWGAQDLYDQGRRASFADMAARPLWRFMRSYFFRGNCLDGRFGLVNSVMDAYAAYLKYAYLWDLERNRSPTPPPFPP